MVSDMRDANIKRAESVTGAKTVPHMLRRRNDRFKGKVAVVRAGMLAERYEVIVEVIRFEGRIQGRGDASHLPYVLLIYTLHTAHLGVPVMPVYTAALPHWLAMPSLSRSFLICP
jgi:hypothetical protein